MKIADIPPNLPLSESSLRRDHLASQLYEFALLLEDPTPKILALVEEYGEIDLEPAYPDEDADAEVFEAWHVANDTAEEYLDKWFQALDAIAPDGCYFGSHPGDGACFGFFEMEE